MGVGLFLKALRVELKFQILYHFLESNNENDKKFTKQMQLCPILLDITNSNQHHSLYKANNACLVNGTNKSLDNCKQSDWHTAVATLVFAQVE